ncbi:DUF2304 family protein [Microbacterium sp. HJ5]
MWIQILLIAAVLVIGFILIRRPQSDSHQALQRIGLLAFIAIAVLSVLFPQWLSWLANLLGVGRGTDLILYALVIIFLGTTLAQYRRISALQRKITVIARRLAIVDAETSDTDAVRGAPSADIAAARADRDEKA